jgi:hypothetical protein
VDRAFLGEEKLGEKYIMMTQRRKEKEKKE